MAKRLLDYDPMTGVASYHHYDFQSGNTVIEYVQDVDPYLENNKAQQLQDNAKQQIKNNWWHVASIPVGVQYKWMTDHGVNVWDKNHKKGVFKLLNDPDYKYLRTTTGNIGKG